MLIFDAHLDLSMNAIEWNRDLTQSVNSIRQCEQGMTDKLDRGLGVVSLPAMRQGHIGLCIATQIARFSDPQHPLPGWRSPEIAWAVTQAQRSWYETMEAAGELLLLRNLQDLDRHLARWDQHDTTELPIGMVLSLEGADSLLTPAHVEEAYGYGLRAIGPAHYGPGRYSPGTGAAGGLTAAGRGLLQQMDDLGIVLDVTHLTDEAFWEALELFQGPLWASHNNCRALVPGQRQFSDEQILAIIERGAVIGAALDAWMLIPDWQRGKTTPAGTGVSLRHVVDHIDHICQLTGNARHVGIGSDLDGGYGREQCPIDLENISDLQRIGDLLGDRGYSQQDLTAIMHGNWIRRLREAWAA